MLEKILQKRLRVTDSKNNSTVSSYSTEISKFKCVFMTWLRLTQDCVFENINLLRTSLSIKIEINF